MSESLLVPEFAQPRGGAITRDDCDCEMCLAARTKPSACTGCGAHPCDCNEAIWSWREKLCGTWVWPEHGIMMQWSKRSVYTRGEALRAREGWPNPPLHRGPVQRVTDPPIDVHECGWAQGAAPRIRQAMEPAAQAKPIEPQLCASEAQLARMLFGASAGVAAAIAQVIEPSAPAGRRMQLIDIMWRGKDGKGPTLPKERAAAEKAARAVFGLVDTIDAEFEETGE